MTASRREGAKPGHVRIRAEQFNTRGLVMTQGWKLVHAIDSFQGPGLDVVDDLRPKVFGFPADNGIAMAQSFIRAIGGMHSSKNDRFPPSTKFICNFIGSGGITGHNGYSNHITGSLKIDIPNGFVQDFNIPCCWSIGGNRW